ncbi:hypothetical protein BD779DRAFT_1564823 [Infundibulicybe gibba]|nr:hypothetical protein BD779DRAFT_1564823 [Infundibulicybe gibba]
MVFSLVLIALILPTAILAQAAVPDGVITVGSFKIQAKTTPIPPSLLTAVKPNGNSTVGTSMNKRTVNDACYYGCSQTCTNLLSPTAPTSGDCASLQSALQALATSEVGGAFPCNFPNQASCPNFSVSPGYELAYTLGTCLVGFGNINPPGGPDVSYCHYLMAGTMPGLYSNCVITAGNTGGYCAQTLQTGSLYYIWVRHS